MSDYEAVIGLEVHVQLNTQSKVFAGVAQGFGQPPNTLVDAVVLGLPGSLPVLNEAAVEQAVRVGLIFDAAIPEVCKWDRKNYFYPDSPKNYQITQYDQPVCVGGTVEIELPGPSRNVMGEHKHIPLTRAHLEEDVGKLTHTAEGSLVDYNRAGTPLLEIVTEPALHNSAEAVALLQSIRMHLKAAGVSPCDMEKGQMRCDANVSVRPRGSTALGKRTEMKNLNSLQGVKQAIDYEIRRQIRVCDKGGQVEQQTRRWDAQQGLTTALRSKEEAHDYRYFPDPDLMPVRFPPERLHALRAALPERVFDQQRRYQEDLGLPYTVTSVLCYDDDLARFFQKALSSSDGRHAHAIANYIANDLQRERAAAVDEGLLPMAELKLQPAHVAELVEVIEEGLITKQIGKEVFVRAFEGGRAPRAIIEAEGLAASQDTGALEAWCAAAIEALPQSAADVRAGNAKAINAFIGPVMKASQGKADPRAAREMLLKLLNG